MTNNLTEEAQHMYMEFQMLSKQMQAIQQHFVKVDESLQELNATENALSEISEVKIGSEILVPMASGIFLKAKLQENSEVLINSGSSVVVQKSIKDAKSLIQSQERELIDFKDNLQEQMEEIHSRMEHIRKKVENV